MTRLRRADSVGADVRGRPGTHQRREPRAVELGHAAQREVPAGVSAAADPVERELVLGHRAGLADGASVEAHEVRALGVEAGGEDLSAPNEAAQVVGDGVEGYTVGDEVYGCAGGLAKLPGTLAE